MCACHGVQPPQGGFGYTLSEVGMRAEGAMSILPLYRLDQALTDQDDPHLGRQPPAGSDPYASARYQACESIRAAPSLSDDAALAALQRAPDRRGTSGLRRQYPKSAEENPEPCSTLARGLAGTGSFAQTFADPGRQIRGMMKQEGYPTGREQHGPKMAVFGSSWSGIGAMGLLYCRQSFRSCLA
jgi:hypothetical protein